MRLVLILLLFCSTVSAQLNLGGTEYNLIDDLGVESITIPRTNQERFGELNWTEINSGNLSSIVKAFIRDAVTHGAELDLDDSRYIVELVSPSHWDYRGTSVPNRERPLGTSYDSTNDGVEIRINSWWWNQLDGIEKVFLVYHELGHAALHQDHVCEFVYGPSYIDPNTGYTRRTGSSVIMAACSSADQVENENYVASIEGLIDHLFEVQIHLPGASVSSRGSNEID